MNTPVTIAPVLPLRDAVMFPRMVMPILVGRQSSVAAVKLAMEGNKTLIVMTQRATQTDDPSVEDLYPVGTLVNVLQKIRNNDGTLKLLLEGRQRVRVSNFAKDESGAMTARAEPMVEDLNVTHDTEALRRTASANFVSWAREGKKVSEDVIRSVQSQNDAAAMADAISCQLPLSIENKIRLLSEPSVSERLNLLVQFIEGEVDILATEKRIQGRVKKALDRNQRNWYLQEQMKAIQKELGAEEESGEGNDIEVYKQRISQAGMSKEAEEKALAEVKKLRMMQPMSAEAAVIRGYIDTLLELPWTKRSKVSTDIRRAAKILNDDHWGLEKVKERILEYLAVQKRVDKVKAPILCFVGGPGVGKTSLGQSIARATNREFVRMALGGVHDESEIRGHRRTYIGSMPGKVIQSLTKSGVRNPLFLLDEIDKIGQDYRGDPAAALLEVLDPEQNRTFQDHYIDVDFDLSDVMFVATSNSYRIPPALLDRMEVINLSGYTEDEKLHIATGHLLPKQSKLNGIRKGELTITESALRGIVRYYTREAGVRGLERSIGKIMRKVVRMNSEGATRRAHVEVTDANLEEFLGVRRYSYGIAQAEPQVGQVNGLAWTEVGGDILSVEAVTFPGKGAVQRTGSLGDVMKESVEAARSVVRARAVKLGLDPEIFGKTDIHVHFPEGATPKDGPSAGAAITTALVSALTGISVMPDVAMTGEITLRGEVLEIGGLKEKLLAALRGGIRKVLIPSANVKDLAEIPDNVKSGMEIVPVRWIDEVLQHALSRQPVAWEPPKASEPITIGTQSGTVSVATQQ